MPFLFLLTHSFKHFPLLSADQTDPDHFFQSESVTSLPGSDRQDSHFVTPIRGDRPLEAKPPNYNDPVLRLKEEPRVQRPCDPVSIRNPPLPPCKEKSAHITVCKKHTASEQSETLQSPPTVCGNCLVPKLN